MQVVVAVVGALGTPRVMGAVIIAEGIIVLGLAAVVVWLCRRVRGLEGGAQRAAAEMRDLIGEAEALSQALADRLSPGARESQTPSVAMPMQAVAAQYGAAERAIQPSGGTAENKDEEDLMSVVSSIAQAQLCAPMGKSLDTDLPLQGDGAPLAGSTRIRRSRRQAAAMEERTDGGALRVEGALAPVSRVPSGCCRTRRGGAGTPAGSTRFFTQADQEQTDAGAVDREAAREKGMDPVGVALQRRLGARRTRI